MLGGDDVGDKRLPEGRLSVLEIGLPKGAPLRHQWVFTGDAVHEYIEAAMLSIHASKDFLHFSLHGVIDANRDGGTTGGTDHPGGLVYGFRTIVRRAVTTHTSSSAINRSTRFPEGSRNASPSAARRASYDRY
jgi:hypothetical protein